MEKNSFVEEIITTKTAPARSYKKALFCAFITFVLAAVWWGIGSQKCGFHFDEIATFVLSNHQYAKPTFVDGKIYKGEDLWEDNLTTAGNRRFDYTNLLINQKGDPHPPQYYLLVHTVASIFPKMSEISIGLLINIPLACVVFWQMVWIFGHLGVEKQMSVLLSVAYVLGTGFVNHAVIFFRMYCLMTVWCNLLLMVFLKFGPEERVSWKYCAALGLTLFGGTMTQYYFLIYAFLLCALYALFVVWNRNWQKLFLSLGMAGITAIITVKVFPVILRDIFSDYRGKEAFKNASMFDSLWKNLWRYLEMINQNTFGGLFIMALAILFVLLIVSSGMKKERMGSKPRQQYCLLTIPAGIYVLIIALVSPMREFRYVSVVADLLYVALFAGLAGIAKRFSLRAVILVLVLAGLMLFTGYKGGLWLLHLNEPERVKQILPYKNSLNIFLYARGRAWDTKEYFLLFRGLDRISFVNEKNWGNIKDMNYGVKSMVLWLANRLKLNHDEVINTVKKANKFKSHKRLYKDGRATVYYLK